MAIDPRTSKKYGGRTQDPRERLGAVLAQADAQRGRIEDRRAGLEGYQDGPDIMVPDRSETHFKGFVIVSIFFVIATLIAVIVF